MKNRLTNLNDALFEQLDRLNDEELSGDKLQSELKRAKAVTEVSTQIIDNAKLVLEAAKLKAQYNEHVTLPGMLEEKGPLERDDD